MGKPQTDYKDQDEMLPEVVKFVQETQKVSSSLIQRKFNFGYARSARLLDILEEIGVIGPFLGSLPREVLIDKDGNIKPPKPNKKSPTKSSKLTNNTKTVKNQSQYLKFNASILEQTLESFGIRTRVVEINNRPKDIEYCLEVALGTRIRDIEDLNKDLAMALSIPPSELKIEAPIPGRSLIAIRTPYINYKGWEPPKFLPQEEEKKEEFPEVKRGDFEEIWRKIRATISFCFYLIARLFAKIADLIYPERK